MMKKAVFTALAFGLLVSSSPSAIAGDGVKALKLMPADTNVAINLNIKRLRGGKAYAEILAQIRQNADFKDTEDALKRAGVNLKRDIDTITLGMRADGKGDPGGVVVVTEGRFKESKIVSAMKAKNTDLKKKKHKGVTYYKLGGDGAMAFLGKKMIMAEPDRIADVIDRFKSKGRKSAAKSRVMKSMLSRTDTKKDAWFVAEIKKASSAGFGVPMASKLKSIVGSFDMIGGLSVRSRISFSDTATPKELVTQWAALRPMAANMDEVKQMGLDVVVDKIQLISDEKDVVMSLDLTAAEAEKLRGLAQAMGGAI